MDHGGGGDAGSVGFGPGAIPDSPENAGRKKGQSDVWPSKSGGAAASVLFE